LFLAAFIKIQKNASNRSPIRLPKKKKLILGNRRAGKTTVNKTITALVFEKVLISKKKQVTE
jgi:predicted AAA+ superfamily ATPase